MFKIWSEPEKTFIRNLKWSLVYEFPQYTFDKIVQFFSTILSPFKPSVMTALKKIIYFSLPFIGLHSLQIRYEITGLRNAAFLHLNVRLIFKSTKRVSSFSISKTAFRHPGTDYSLFFFFKCQCCFASYVGQTTRHLLTQHRYPTRHLLTSPFKFE